MQLKIGTQLVVRLKIFPYSSRCINFKFYYHQKILIEIQILNSVEVSLKLQKLFYTEKYQIQLRFLSSEKVSLKPQNIFYTQECIQLTCLFQCYFFFFKKKSENMYLINFLVLVRFFFPSRKEQQMNQNIKFSAIFLFFKKKTVNEQKYQIWLFLKQIFESFQSGWQMWTTYYAIVFELGYYFMYKLLWKQIQLLSWMLNCENMAIQMMYFFNFVFYLIVVFFFFLILCIYLCVV
eukprot:TRINITY_DN36432_c0_g1_i7.p1 TRINITY_DN36432_c0_g1~~TRINITY_DN36432_c0_g1_i7.p1  ORF type:complete len:235 (-),score=-8.50 TRINITY_DN36432_c0_g1_i7:401-1105(-)